MTKDKVGLIGKGFVGGALYELLKDRFDVQVYDKFKKEYQDKDAVNSCKITFICVPTPMKDDMTCDLSAIEESVEWCTSQILVIKSTVPPGTTERLNLENRKDTLWQKIIHNPEFLREQTAVEDLRGTNRTLLGGDNHSCKEVARLYQQVYDSDMVYVFTTSTMTEFIKYATNIFFATKVALINEYSRFCDILELNYEEFREYWLLEPRIGRHHTQITKERGFGGTCLPKDLNALITTMEKKGYSSDLLKEVWNQNCAVRE